MRFSGVFAWLGYSSRQQAGPRSHAQTGGPGDDSSASGVLCIHRDAHEIALISGIHEWLICGLIIAVATAGKFGGTLLAARLTGSGWRPAAALGVLMNTRGLMELIVLNVGLELGVISQKLFTMMVLMALATTMSTAPILRRLIPAR